MVPLTKFACPHKSNKLNLPHGSEYFTSPLGGRGVILAYLLGAADVIFTQQLVTCQCWSRQLQLVLLIQNFSDRSAQESSHVVLWCLWQTNMNGRVFLSVSLTSKELSILPKRAPLPVFNALGLCCQPYEWCKSLLTLIPSVQAVCKQCCYAILPAVEEKKKNQPSQVFYMESFCNDTILCSFSISSCLLSPSFCHVLLLLMPTIHH